LSVIERNDAEPSESAAEWYERGAALESEDRPAAIEAYQHALAADPDLLEARINLGWLLHDGGRLARAERVYREAPAAQARDPLLLYNLGVLLEDRGRKSEAIDAYEGALRADPSLADCHYNLALLCEALGRPQDAIRHMAQYRRLTGARSR
jgi:tetratricopeptide (TPR) repeat protein